MEKDKEKNYIDYGSWTVPDSWDKVTLKKFQDIQNYYDGISGETKFDIREVLHILCDKTLDEVNALPAEFLDLILEKLAFLQEQPEIKEPSNKIEINGEKYIIHTENKLKTGEFIASDTVLKQDPHNIAALLAIVCRKEGELYDSKYENEILDDRIKMFENQPVVNILPLINFFMNSYIVLESFSLLYIKVQEAVNHIQQSIATSQKIGRCKKYCLRWRVNRIQKSLKSISHMQGTSSSTSVTSFKNRKWKRLKKNFRII